MRALFRRPRPRSGWIETAILILVLSATPSAGQVFTEFGDAPEGFTAYPWLGVGGRFPTCEFGGPAGYIKHFHPGMPMTAPLHLGPDSDPEPDGNGGLCPPPPYDQDECGFTTGDAGLSVPDPFTIGPHGDPVPCDGFLSRALGSTCEVLVGGAGSWFEGTVTNDDLLEEAYLNVLIDWNQDGEWGGAPSFCGPDRIDEHVIQNVVIPPGYSGFLSGLSLPNIHVGPDPGHVWMRMTVTPKFPAVPVPWDGSGEWDGGETEDYLIEITEPEPGELGDAPEGALAYPSGTPGRFPTCRFVGPNGYILHTGPTLAFFGPDVDYESDGNDGQCPPGPYDSDECFGAPDAGLVVPEPVTLDPTGSVTTCGGTVVPRWQACRTGTWGPDLDLTITNNATTDRYLHVLADWNGNGEWEDPPTTSPCGGMLPERVALNVLVPGGYSGLTSGLGLTTFEIGAPPDGLAWLRFSITDDPVGPEWLGNGVYSDGETEDYLIPIELGSVDVGDGASLIPGTVRIASVRPNPMRGTTEIALVAPGQAPVEIAIHDASGRLVRRLERRELAAGPHTVSWDGRTDDGRDAAAGTYFVRVRAGAAGDTRRLVLIR